MLKRYPQDMLMGVLPSPSRCLILGAALLATPCFAQIHVSPTGNDANPGTQARPVRTLQHAVALAHGLEASATGDVTIELAGGTYRLEQPLALTPEDSGRNGHNLVFAAQAGAHPIVSGGRQISGWKKVDGAKNGWSAGDSHAWTAPGRRDHDGDRIYNDRRDHGGVEASLGA
jgi:hypothetical protein